MLTNDTLIPCGIAETISGILRWHCSCVRKPPPGCRTTLYGNIGACDSLPTSSYRARSERPTAPPTHNNLSVSSHRAHKYQHCSYPLLETVTWYEPLRLLRTPKTHFQPGNGWTDYAKRRQDEFGVSRVASVIMYATVRLHTLKKLHPCCDVNPRIACKFPECVPAQQCELARGPCWPPEMR